LDKYYSCLWKEGVLHVVHDPNGKKFKVGKKKGVIYASGEWDWRDIPEEISSRFTATFKNVYMDCIVNVHDIGIVIPSPMLAPQSILSSDAKETLRVVSNQGRNLAQAIAVVNEAMSNERAFYSTKRGCIVRVVEE